MLQWLNFNNKCRQVWGGRSEQPIVTRYICVPPITGLASFHVAYSVMRACTCTAPFAARNGDVPFFCRVCLSFLASVHNFLPHGTDQIFSASVANGLLEQQRIASRSSHPLRVFMHSDESLLNNNHWVLPFNVPPQRPSQEKNLWYAVDELPEPLKSTVRFVNVHVAFHERKKPRGRG